ACAAPPQDEAASSAAAATRIHNMETSSERTAILVGGLIPVKRSAAPTPVAARSRLRLDLYVVPLFHCGSTGEIDIDTAAARNAKAVSISGRLAAFVAGLELEQVPSATRRRAALLLLDAMGVALAAASFEFGRRAVRGLGTLGGGTARVIGMRERLAL